MTTPQINLKDPKILVRAILGVLLLTNLVAAVFAFHLLGDTPAELEAQLATARAGVRAANIRLNRGHTLLRNMDRSKEEGDKFLASYMTSRRTTFSTILDEINSLAKDAGMKAGDKNLAFPEPIEGSEDLSMLSITAGFEGTYPQLVKFVNLLDRSKRFLLIESLQVAPQPKGDVLNVSIKLDTFIRDDKEGAL